jgi:hypothetical protein
MSESPLPSAVSIYDRPPWYRRRAARVVALAIVASLAGLAGTWFWLN